MKTQRLTIKSIFVTLVLLFSSASFANCDGGGQTGNYPNGPGESSKSMDGTTSVGNGISGV